MYVKKMIHVVVVDVVVVVDDVVVVVRLKIRLFLTLSD